MLLKCFQLLMAFSVLVLCLFLGKGVALLTGVPLPGALSGLIILFFGLLFMRQVPKPLQQVCQFLLRHLSIFFVPASLSILVLKDKLADHLMLIVAVLVVSTFASMLISAWVCRYCLETKSQERKWPEGEEHD